MSNRKHYQKKIQSIEGGMDGQGEEHGSSASMVHPLSQ